MTHPFGGGPGKPGVLEGQEKARTHTRPSWPPAPNTRRFGGWVSKVNNELVG
jgi:hypothetical protein